MSEENKTTESNQTPSIEDMIPSDIYSYLKLFMSTLAGQAWIYLGLTFHPKTKTINKDLEQAKLAIDCFELLFNRIKDKLSSKESSDFAEVLSNLQVNFIEKSKESPSKDNNSKSADKSTEKS